ncbi:MAG: ATP-binding protein [Nanoarchaeota archaeon]|nr:ATP-binding protein [Nanoarchaeota archaeon]
MDTNDPYEYIKKVPKMNYDNSFPKDRYPDPVISPDEIARIMRDVKRDSDVVKFSRPTPVKKEGADALKPLDGIFLADATLDEVLMHTSIPELIEGKEPGYGGIIVYGPPGTGKTAVLKAIAEVYANVGAFSQSVDTAAVNGSYVGEFARNLEKVITQALAEANRRGKSSFVYFDEGSSVAQKATVGATSVSKHYQEALDVLKRVIGNDRRVILGIATNEDPGSLDDALTREGRLKKVEIGYPAAEQRAQMWGYFAQKYGVLAMSPEQAVQLAEVTPSEQGALIEEFCRNYVARVRSTAMKQRGYRNLRDALKAGLVVDEQALRKLITFESFLADVKNLVAVKYKHTEPEQEKVGFSVKE